VIFQALIVGRKKDAEIGQMMAVSLATIAGKTFSLFWWLIKWQSSNTFAG
jgi:hypothetical protein